MKDKTNIGSESLIFEEGLKSCETNIRFVLGIFIIFLLNATVIRFVLGVPFPSFIFFLLSVWVLIYLLYYYYIRNKKDERNLNNFYFARSVIDLILITVAIHFLGGVEWIGAILYLSVLSWASAVLPKRKVFILSFMAIFFYLALALLEYAEFLPHRMSFDFPGEPYKDLIYIFVQILVLTIIFLFIGQNYGTLSDNFRKSQKKLLDSQDRLKEAKNVLEIRVQARTKELQELTKGLEKEVQRRTKEAQTKVEELERFKNLAVGRELKMIELKEEIEKLKKQNK